MIKRKDNGSSADEDGPSKCVKGVEQSSPCPPHLGFENPLLALANTYDYDADEEEYNRRRELNNGLGGDNRAKVEDDDEDDLANGQGKRSRVIEVRRDCPYLDTVNRQVLDLILRSFARFLCQT